MSTEANKALVRRIYDEMWNQANPAAAGELFSLSDGVRLFVSEFLAAFPDLQHSIEEIIAEEDRVAVRFSARGTHTGPWRGIPASHKPIHYTGVTLATVAEGKISVHHTWWDILDVIEQIKA
jgi:steroid delta-isomerase-like uncharacterized protein